jgi:DNA-binding transcriptional regulator LsrR (DeoR family)
MKLEKGKESDLYTEENLEQRLMVRSAWMYYEEDLTQQELSERLGVSRIKVNRLFKKARENGIVQITIKSSYVNYLKMESQLREKYSLTDVIITHEAKEGEPLYRLLADAAAGFISQRLTDGMVIGLGLGSTTTRIVDYLSVEDPVDCTFMALTGGVVNTESGGDMQTIIHDIADRVGGSAKFIYAPFATTTHDIKDAILSDKKVKASLKEAANCDLILFSIGPVNPPGLLYENKYLTDQDLKDLQKHGAVGDALGRFFDSRGELVPTGFDQRIIGISLEDIRRIPLSVVAAGGPAKYQALLGFLQGKNADVLITDRKTAQWLLNQDLKPTS